MTDPVQRLSSALADRYVIERELAYGGMAVGRLGGMLDSSARLKAAVADRYEIHRELGQGGMATVYLAEDLKHDRRVAIGCR